MCEDFASNSGDKKNWLLYQDNAPPDTSFFTREFFFTKNNMTVVLHPHYVSLLPRVNATLKGRHFDTIEIRARNAEQVYGDI
jgi:hypothetical protein